MKLKRIFFSIFRDINMSLVNAETVPNNTEKPNNMLDRYLEVRHLIDIIQQIPTAVSISEFFKYLRPLIPRFYSISCASDPKKISVIIQVQRYTLLDKPRFGVTGKYLSSLPIGSNVALYVVENKNFRLPKDNSKPIILVAAGTGVAPVLSFLQEREKVSASNNTFFFGCKYPNADNLYKNYFEGLQKENKLKLFNAFSRQTKDKVYVQHLLKQNPQYIWDLITAGAHIYVCGSKEMGDETERIFRDIFKEHGKLDTDDKINDFCEKLKHEYRFQYDVWSEPLQ